ncbi:phosphoadenosine phosphosulfate reductase domain-containing protein [Enterovibrio norvegicus]|uniref:phosphoadenosine phosphosulfate reductase domain-containing protein n=1 Tax=Enterovibrio norvegicus TaxID=188144 RepID=UPI000C84B810|nr:phosphoadenosine phosphosulfate reductase family protein [Enterovibrio norvegicus]PMH64520.1 hypothetical protein BCU62_15815 [Enterovibrio norvegicus]
MKYKELIHVVSFSGGRSSAFLVYQMEVARKKYGWNVVYIFTDTGVESPKTYKFIRDVVKHWGINLVILRAKVNPTLHKGNSYEVFTPNDLMDTSVMPPFEPFFSIMKKYGTPNISGPFCSDRMKKDVSQAYCRDHFGKGNYITWLGIRSDEKTRLKGNRSGIKYLADLIEIEKPDVVNWWKQQPFDLELDEEEGNCLLCIKKSIPKLALAMKKNPGFYHQWIYHIADPSVREKPGYDKKVMYRGHLSLEGIAKLYENTPEDEIQSAVSKGKRFDTSSCSESCESFKADDVDFDEVDAELYRQFHDELNLKQLVFTI